MADFFKEMLTDIDKLSNEQVNQLMAALEVKRAGGQTTKDSIKENDETPLACPHCGSISLKRHGKAGGRQRYRCKDCCKTFCETSQTLMHHSRLSPAQWKGLLLGMVQNLTLQEIANTINTSVTTVWFNKQKVCMTLEEAYRNYAGQFIDIVECDEYYTTVSFKGKRDPTFFINVLGRMPRHHMTLEEKMDYLSKHGLLEGLKKDLERAEHAKLAAFYPRQEERNPATKYLGLQLKLFWWLEVNGGLSTQEKVDTLYGMIKGRNKLECNHDLNCVFYYRCHFSFLLVLF